jgi:hypothetical protein
MVFKIGKRNTSKSNNLTKHSRKIEERKQL